MCLFLTPPNLPFVKRGGILTSSPLIKGEGGRGSLKIILVYDIDLIN
jgi:hypothetical protein